MQDNKMKTKNGRNENWDIEGYEEIGSMLKSNKIRGDKMKKKYLNQVKISIAALKRGWIERI